MTNASTHADLTALDATTLSAVIADREASCVEVMQAYLQRIHRINPTFNAIVSLIDDDTALAAAADADRALAAGEYQGWMHGFPHAVKDLANVRGMPTSFGSPIFAGTVAQADDLIVARMRAAGALFIGKTNTPEFGLGSQSYNPVFGVTRNAWDPALAAGGSSGGAAVALAQHLLPVADGGDMMGSLRNPAAFNDVVGFRPSQGRVPTAPSENPFYSQLATLGPMGRTVQDTIRLLCTLAGPDPRAPLSRTDLLPAPEDFVPAELRGLSVGWLGNHDGHLATEPGLLELCEAALDDLAAQGAVVEPCAAEFDMQRLWRCWLVLRQWGLLDRRALYDDPALRAQLKPEFVWEIEQGLALDAAQVAEAAVARGAWLQALLELFERFDLLALPSAQVFPFPAEVHWPDAIDGRRMDTYHRWMEVVIGASLGGLPVVSLPAGFDDRQRPMGIQFMGPPGADRAVLEFALAWEALTGFSTRRPPEP